MTAVEQVVRGVLLEGVDDWLPLDVLIWHARQHAQGVPGGFKQVVLDALEKLLAERLALVGDIGDRGFQSWSVPTAEAIGRIVAECNAVNWEPYGSLCWISNTLEGTQFVQQDGAGLA